MLDGEDWRSERLRPFPPALRTLANRNAPLGFLSGTNAGSRRRRALRRRTTFEPGVRMPTSA
jgi:hypothetical protein